MILINRIQFTLNVPKFFRLTLTSPTSTSSNSPPCHFTPSCFEMICNGKSNSGSVQITGNAVIRCRSFDIFCFDESLIIRDILHKPLRTRSMIFTCLYTCIYRYSDFDEMFVRMVRRCPEGLFKKTMEMSLSRMTL